MNKFLAIFLVFLLCLLFAQTVSAAWSITACDLILPSSDPNINEGGSFTMTVRVTTSGSAGGWAAPNVHARGCTGSGCSISADIPASGGLSTAGTNPQACGNGCKNAATDFTWTIDGSTAATYGVDGRCESAIGNLNSADQAVTVSAPPADVTLPAVVNAKPLANSQFNQTQAINVSVNVTDNILVGTVRANITFPNSTRVILTMLNGSKDLFNVTFTPSITEVLGTYNITFLANDSSGNLNNTVTTNFILNDIAKPSVLTVAVNKTRINQTQAVNISANVTDNIGIGTVRANITFPNGTIIISAMTNGSRDLFAVSFTPSINEIPGQYNVTILANDTSGNLNNTQKIAFNVSDVTVPSAVSLTPLADTEFNQSIAINISVNITDNFAVGFAFASVTYSNGTNQNLSMTNGSKDLFNVTFNTTTSYPTGSYNLTIFANDTSGNLNNTQKTNFTITSTADLIFPTVVNVFCAPSTTFPTSNITCNATVADDIAVSLVVANVTLPNATLINFTTTSIGDNYSFKIGGINTSINGIYTVNWFANDTSNNINRSGVTTFLITQAQFMAFTLTLPGQSSVIANSTQNATSANIEFNATANEQFNVTPCVVGGICQNATTPIFSFVNIGSIIINWSINLNESLPSSIVLKSSNTSTGAVLTILSETVSWLARNMQVNDNASIWLFTDFTDARAGATANTTTRSLLHQANAS